MAEGALSLATPESQTGVGGDAPIVESKPLADTPLQAPVESVQPEPTAQLAAEAPPPAQETEPAKPAESYFQTKVAKFRQAGFTNQEISDYTMRAGGKMLANGFTQDEVNEYMGIKAPNMTGVQDMIKQNLDVQQAEGENSKNIMGFPKMLDKALGMPVSTMLEGNIPEGFVFPPAMRKHLTDAYAAGTATDAGDFMQQAIPAAAKTASGDEDENGFVNLVKTQGFLAAPPLWLHRNIIKPILDKPEEFTKATDAAQKTAIDTFKNLDPEAKDNYWSKLLSTPLVSKETNDKADAEMKARSNGEFWHDLRVRIEARSPAAMEAVMNAPPGQFLKVIGGAPGANQIFTAVTQYGAPAVAKELGTNPDTVMVVAMLAPFAHKTAEKLPEVGSARHTTYYNTGDGRILPTSPSGPEISEMVGKAAPAFKEAAPTAQNFLDTALVMFGHDRDVTGAAYLHDVYNQTGVKPAQLWEDAKNNPQIAKDAQAHVIPKAYENLIEKPAEKPVAVEAPKEPEKLTPPEGVQYSDLDPNSKAFQTAKEIAAEHNIELQPYPKEGEAQVPTQNQVSQKIDLKKPEKDILTNKDLPAQANDTGVPKAEAVAEAPKAPNSQAKLPLNLAGAKPRYNYGSKGFTLKFDSDVDRAAFITSQKTKSKADAKYRQFLKDNGYSDAAIDKLGADVRAHIKALAKDGEPGELQIENQTRPKLIAGPTLKSLASDTGIDKGESLAEAPFTKGESPVESAHGHLEFEAFSQNYPHTVTGSHQAATDWVKRKTAETGVEHGVAIDEKGKLVGEPYYGTKGDIEANEKMLAAYSDPNNKITFHHSHTAETPLSPGDMGTMAYDGQSEIVAHTPEGKFSAAKLTPEMKEGLSAKTMASKKMLIRDVVREAIEKVTKYLEDKIGNGLDHKIAATRGLDIVNAVLHKAGVIDYATSHDLSWMPKDVKTFVDKAADEVHAYVKDKKGIDNGKSRSNKHPLGTLSEGGIDRLYNPHGSKAEDGISRQADSGRERGSEAQSGISSEDGHKAEQSDLDLKSILDIQRSDPKGFADYIAARRAVEQSIKGEEPDMSLDKAFKILEEGRDKFESAVKALKEKPPEEPTPEPKAAGQLIDPEFAREEREPPTIVGRISGAISKMITADPAARASVKSIGDLANVSKGQAAKIVARYIHELFSPSTVSDVAKETTQVLRKESGESARETAVVQNALNKVWRTASKLIGEQKNQFIDYMQNRSKGAQIDPALQEIADTVRDIYKDREEQLRALPGNEFRQFVRDYFTQNWKDTEAAKKFMDEFLAKQGSERNLRRRSIPTHAEGIAYGLEDKFDNPLETVMNYIHNIDKYIANTKALAELQERGLAERFKEGTEPVGYTEIKGGLGEENAEGKLYALDDAARLYNNSISEWGKVGNDIFKALNYFSNFERRMKLGFLNLYHGVTVLRSSIGSEAGLGFGQLLDIPKKVGKGEIGGAGKNLVEGAVRIGLSPLAPIKHFIEGGKGLAEYKEPGSTDPHTQAIISNLTKANSVTNKMPDYMRSGAYTDLWDGMKRGDFDDIGRKAAEFAKAGNLKVTIPKKVWETFGRTMDTFARPIFSVLVPRLKTGAAMEAMGKWMDEHPNATEEQQLKASATIGDSMDNRFGEMIQKNLFWNPTMRNSMNLAFLSYSWVLGEWRGVLGGAKDLATLKNTPNAQYILGTLTTMAMTNAIMTYLHTGEAPQDEKDLIAYRTGGEQKSGRATVPERAFLAGHESQLTHTFHDPFHELFVNESNPFIKTTLALISGKDWADNDITNKNNSWFSSETALKKAADYANFIKEEYKPLSLGNITSGPKVGSGLSATERAVGVRQVPRFIADPEGDERDTKKRNDKDWKAGEKFRKRQKATFEDYKPDEE